LHEKGGAEKRKSGEKGGALKKWPTVSIEKPNLARDEGDRVFVEQFPAHESFLSNPIGEGL
jgi:hypothetical protein